MILDQTLFFPEEGGQSADRGSLDGQEVLDVQIKNDVIRHTMRRPIEIGRKVTGKLDWKHRFYNMQQHSGEHLFSGLVHSRFGFDNVGFHLSDQIVTMDFNGPIPVEAIEEIEYQVNQAITENFEVVVTFPSKEELKDIEYRSKIEIEGQVRLVTYPGYDCCACCAPHVRRTGEIGCLKVMNVSNYKGGVRISILCGFRALLAFREKAAVVSDLMGILTTGQEKLSDSVSKLKNANTILSSQLAAAKQQLLSLKLKELPEDAENALLFEQGLDSPIMRNAVNEMAEKYDGYAVIFNGDDEQGYSYIIGSRKRDCRDLAALLKEKLGAKGGGSPEMIQGSLKVTEADIRKIICQELK